MKTKNRRCYFDIFNLMILRNLVILMLVTYIMEEIHFSRLKYYGSDLIYASPTMLG